MFQWRRDTFWFQRWVLKPSSKETLCTFWTDWRLRLKEEPEFVDIYWESQMFVSLNVHEGHRFVWKTCTPFVHGSLISEGEGSSRNLPLLWTWIRLTLDWAPDRFWIYLLLFISVDWGCPVSELLVSLFQLRSRCSGEFGPRWVVFKGRLGHLMSPLTHKVMLAGHSDRCPSRDTPALFGWGSVWTSLWAQIRQWKNGRGVFTCF